MSPSLAVHPVPAGLLIALLAILPCGCASLSSNGALPLTATESGSATGEPSVDTPVVTHSCSVELRTSARRAKIVEVPLGAETRVQDALDASRASAKFRNPEVVILRPTNHASEPTLKLSCRFDHKKRRIGWESDYAILPGDRIVVREGPAVGLDKLFGSMLGPTLGGR